MKKLLALLLVLGCLFSMAACQPEKATVSIDNDKKTEEKEDKKKEDKAKEAVKNYMDALCKLNAKKARKYLDDPKALEVEFEDADEFVKETAKLVEEKMPEGFSKYSSDYEKLLELLVEKRNKCTSYEIANVQEEKGDYIFKVKVTSPKAENLEKIFVGLYKETKEKLEKDEKINVEMSDEEVFDIIIPEFIKSATKDVKKLEIETQTEEKKFVVIEKDGKWSINAKRSDLK